MLRNRGQHQRNYGGRDDEYYRAPSANRAGKANINEDPGFFAMFYVILRNLFFGKLIDFIWMKIEFF